MVDVSASKICKIIFKIGYFVPSWTITREDGTTESSHERDCWLSDVHYKEVTFDKDEFLIGVQTYETFRG